MDARSVCLNNESQWECLIGWHLSAVRMPPAEHSRGIFACVSLFCVLSCMTIYVSACVIYMSLCVNQCVSVWEDEAVGAYLHVSLCVGTCHCVCV